MQFAEDPSASVEDRQTLARVWLARGEPGYTARARAILEQLVKSGNQSPELLNDTGVAMLQLERYSEAINYFNQALAKAPSFHEALFNKAIAEQRAGRHAEAQEVWKKFIETSSDEKWKDEAQRYLK
jgi:tetratricopeptide (TPR) repeat protein